MNNRLPIKKSIRNGQAGGWTSWIFGDVRKIFIEVQIYSPPLKLCKTASSFRNIDKKLFILMANCIYS